MRALERKLLRDLWRLKGQGLAITLLLGCGLTTFVGAKATWESLRRSQDAYYERYRFADVFASLRRAPANAARRLGALPGVAAVEARVVADVPLEVPGVDEPIGGRLIGLSGQPSLNRLHLRSGRLAERGQRSEAVVGEAFAAAHRLRPGSRLTAILRGRRQVLDVVGVALSPEYIFTVRPGDLLPDDRHFGVIWVDAEALAGAIDLRGAFNDLALRLEPGASAGPVIAEVDRQLEPYGGLGAFGRDRHVSHRFFTDEVRQLKATAVVVPTIFLFIAAFLLQVVLGRVVATQRESIAVLKAFGYSRWQVGAHYAELAGLVILVGAGAGVVGGHYLGAGMTALYASYYKLPVFLYALNPGDLLAAGLLAGLAALVGAAGAVRRVLRLPAATALRPEPPASFRRTWLERTGLPRLLSSTGRMVLRNVGRRPGRALLSAASISFGVALLVVGGFFDDTMSFLLDQGLRQAQRETAAVSFKRALPLETMRELGRLPGVSEVEPLRVAPARLRHGPRSYLTAVQGLSDEGRLRRLLDRHHRPVRLPAEGLVLSIKLADVLEVRPGETVVLEFLDGRRPVREVLVAALVDDLMGVSASLRLLALNRLLGEGPTANGALLAAERTSIPSLTRRLRALPGIEGVTIREAAIRSFRKVMDESVLVMAGVLLAFACVIAAGVVYNGARITLAERERELSTLRLIGLTHGEVSRVLLGELAVHLVIGVPLGLGLGVGLAAISAAGMNTDLFRVPLVIAPSTFLFAAGVILLASLLVGWGAQRRLSRLDWVSVLKTKE